MTGLAWTLFVCLLATSPLCLSCSPTVFLDPVASECESSAPLELDGESSPFAATGHSRSDRQRATRPLSDLRRPSDVHRGRAIFGQLKAPGRDIVLLFKRFLC